MILDYRIPSFSLTVGDLDISEYIDSVTLSLPMAEMGTILSWAGDFTLSYNQAAIKAGLSESDFSSWAQPNRWRPGIAPVWLTFYGYQFPALRIGKYAYNEQDRKGAGTLTQLISLMATDRPADLLVGGGVVASQLPMVSVGGLIDKLTAEAFRDASVNPPRLLGNQPGQYYGLLSSRNPLRDAAGLLGKYWLWMVLDAAETITVASGDPTASSVVFNRSLAQCEYTPDIEQIDFAAKRVIVTGAYQWPVDRCGADPQPPNTDLDRKARPKYQQVEERQPTNKVFAAAIAANDTSPRISEIKSVFYQYPDDLTWDSRLGALVSTSILFELQNDAPIAGQPVDSPSQTVTVYQWPIGRIYSSQGMNAVLATAAIEVQSERRKIRWAPIGVLNPAQAPNLVLTIERHEKITTVPVIAGFGDHGGMIDPRTGNAQCLVPRPREESRQLSPQYLLETVPIKGVARVQPLGWTPIAERDLVLEVGFLPSVEQANYLAQQVAQREWRRRDSAKVTMPLPIEWLAAGCPPMPIAKIGGDNWQCEGLILVMDLPANSCSFSFLANRIDRGGVRQVVSISAISLQWAVLIAAKLVDAPIAPPTPAGTAAIGFAVLINVAVVLISSPSQPSVTHSLSSGTIMEGTGLPSVTHSLSSGTIMEGT